MSGTKLSFQNIGLQGQNSVGITTFKDDRIEWRDRGNVHSKDFSQDEIEVLSWSIFGIKCHMKVHTKDGQVHRLDGFVKSDFETIDEFSQKNYGRRLSVSEV
jgi:propanediol dehydratase large subunit